MSRSAVVEFDITKQPSLFTLLSAEPLLFWQARAATTVTSQSLPMPVVAQIRLWGDALNTATCGQLLNLLAEQCPNLMMQWQVYQPHPRLTPALQMRLSELLPAAVVQQLRQLAIALSFELNYQTKPVLLTEPGVLVMDMDSTAIQIECIDEIAKLAGTGEQVAAVTAAAMRGELDFAQSLRQRVATLQDAPVSILQTVLDNVPLMPGLEALVQHLLERQWSVAIASGGFTFFTEALKTKLGLTATFANELEQIDGRLTGQVLGDIVDAKRKAEVVSFLAATRHIPGSQTVAVGDGANDLPMLAQAALGVAFHAKPLVQAQAQFAIRQGSLLQLLYLLDDSDWLQ